MMIENALRFLGERYKAFKNKPPTKMVSSENREYLLKPITKQSFKEYDVKPGTFTVVAIDGGSVALFDTPYWGIAFIKVRARKILFEGDKKVGTTIDTKAYDDFVLFLSDQFPEQEKIVTREFFEKGNCLKRIETGFARSLLKEGWVGEKDLLLIDGTLGGQFYERDIISMHPYVLGVSKRSAMMINKYSATGYITLRAQDYGLKKPWYCYPLVEQYPSREHVSDILFATFVKNAKTAFRIDLPHKMNEWTHEDVDEILVKVATFSLDPKYTDYPYPLGAVHSDAVMRPIDRERAQKFVEKEIMRADLPEEIKVLIRKDIEIDKWYDKFRKRA